MFTLSPPPAGSPSIPLHFHYTLSFPVCFADIEFSSLAAWD